MIEEIKKTDAPEIRGIKDRNASYGDVNQLGDVNTPGSGNSFGVKDGDEFEVPQNIYTCKYDVRAGQTNGAKMCLILVSMKHKGMSKAQPAWLSLNSIAKRDINGVPVNPDLQFSNYQDLANHLAGKKFKSNGVISIDVAAYEDNGTRKVRVDENNVERVVTKKQDVCRIIEA